MELMRKDKVWIGRSQVTKSLVAMPRSMGFILKLMVSVQLSKGNGSGNNRERMNLGDWRKLYRVMPRNLGYCNSSDRWMRVQTQAGTARVENGDGIYEVRSQADRWGWWGWWEGWADSQGSCQVSCIYRTCPVFNGLSWILYWLC